MRTRTRTNNPDLTKGLHALQARLLAGQTSRAGKAVRANPQYYAGRISDPLTQRLTFDGISEAEKEAIMRNTLKQKPRYYAKLYENACKRPYKIVGRLPQTLAMAEDHGATASSPRQISLPQLPPNPDGAGAVLADKQWDIYVNFTWLLAIINQRQAVIYAKDNLFRAAPIQAFKRGDRLSITAVEIRNLLDFGYTFESTEKRELSLNPPTDAGQDTRCKQANVNDLVYYSDPRIADDLVRTLFQSGITFQSPKTEKRKKRLF